MVVFVVNANLVPDEAGEDAGPAAGASDGACVVRLGAAAAVVASKVTNSNINAIGALEMHTRLINQSNCITNAYCIARLLRGQASESLGLICSITHPGAKRCFGLHKQFVIKIVMSPSCGSHVAGLRVQVSTGRGACL